MPRYVCLALILGLLAILGCSSTGNPSLPGTPSGTNSEITAGLPVMVDTFDADRNPVSGAGIMGIFTGHIDLQSMAGELIPLRNVTLDDTLEIVDISNFLQLAPCGDCAKLFNVELDPDGNIALNIGIRHPFETGDPLKPITGRNRADLHVFNVEGTVVFDDSAGSTSYADLGMTSGLSCLINADGYSPYLDTSLDDIFPTNATLHPYKLHFDDYTTGNYNPSVPTGFESVTTPPPTGNLVMAMGSDYDIQQYLFAPPDDSSFDFMFAIGCTYAVSAGSKIERFTPEYQVPQHNKKAASEVGVEIVDNLLTEGDTASTCELLIKVLDINHGVPVGDGLDEMFADSSVGGVFVEVPGVTSGAVEGSSTPTGGDGRDPDNPLTFSLTFTNDLDATEGMYTGLVKIADTYPPGSNTSPLLNGLDGISRVDPLDNPLSGLYSLSEFATYMVFEVEVIAASHAPEASFTTDPEGDPNLAFDFLDYPTITFTSTSTDPDDPATPAGQIIVYEWDFVWDGDPANFQDDTAGMGTDVEVWEVDRGGSWYAGLRVTDGGSPPLQSEIYSIQVDINPWSKDFSISQADGRIPKIAAMPSGDLMCIWVSSAAQTRYSVFDDGFTDPADAWSTPGAVNNNSPNYLSIYAGPGQDECWAGGSTRFFHYDGTAWSQTATTSISHCLQTHIYADEFDGYGVFDNTSSAFGWIIRLHWDSISQGFQSFFQYIVLYSYNNRLLGESRIIDKNSNGQIFLVYMQDFAIDPYRPPQDQRYVVVARVPQNSSGQNNYAIDQGPQDTLDSVVIACDSTDKLHVAYLSQPNGGGDFSILYKSSTNDGTSWGSQSTVWTGASEPEAEYISIDTDDDDRIMVTYTVDDTIYWVYSDDGSSWSEAETVNTTWPGGTTDDKEQYMVVDTKGRTHVVWDRCAAGPSGFGPILHKVRAPVH